MLVISDPGGIRVGSGGSTIHCLIELLNRERTSDTVNFKSPAEWLETLKKLRVLIVHVGGDSRRLPPYGPCGKIFIPIPGETDTALPTTLFDRQLPTYLNLPAGEPGNGQVVVTTGDVILDFDPAEVRLASRGITGLGCYSSPEQASRHGVFCASADGSVDLFLQKPSLNEQHENGAIARCGQTILDIGIMSWDAETSMRMLELFNVVAEKNARLVWSGPLARSVLKSGLDFYLELCCAMGVKATFDHLVKSAKNLGSSLTAEELKQIFDSMNKIPFSVHVLRHCNFLHFGTLDQLISSGDALLRNNSSISKSDFRIEVNNRIGDRGDISARVAWVEGCSIDSELTLAGNNVVVGLDINEPFSLPRKCVYGCGSGS